MRKLFAVTALAIVAGLMAVPSHATNHTCVTDGTSGAIVLGGGPDLSVTCSYTADGDGTAAPATPNSWKIVAERTDANGNVTTVPLASSGTLGAPGPIPIASQAGDKVIITLGGGPDNPDCAPGDVCGTVGVLIVGNSP